MRGKSGRIASGKGCGARSPPFLGGSVRESALAAMSVRGSVVVGLKKRQLGGFGG